MKPESSDLRGESSKSNRRRLGRGGSATLLAHGEPMLWLTGGGLALAGLMIVGLLLLVFYQGFFTFWPVSVPRFTLVSGAVHMGEVTRDDYFQPAEHVVNALPESARAAARTELDSRDGWAHRRLIRTGNYDISKEHFDWVSDFEITKEEHPEWAVTMERLTWGRFNGEPQEFHLRHFTDDFESAETVAERNRLRTEQAHRIARELPPSADRQVQFEVGARLADPESLTDPVAVTAVVEVWSGPRASWEQFMQYHGPVRARWQQRRKLERVDTGRINHRKEKQRLALRQAELDYDRAVAQSGPESARAKAAATTVAARQEEYRVVDEQTQKDFLRVREEITRLNRENARYRIRMAATGETEKTIELAEVVRAYLPNRIGFREKLGIYFSRWAEFLADDPREANMEGGVFPAIFGTVIMTLVMSLAVVPFGVLAALYLREYAKAGPMISAVRIAVNNLAGVPSIVFGVFGLGFFCYLVGGGIDQLFFQAKLPSPTFGTGGILWASLTLALMTLPVVIVATEEALAAVPGSMREGSYACGASKWQTIRRIVLPRAMPGILTGAILAMARGAGEVAPLMIVGAVKLAPELPVDRIFPFLHPERSFMHLGFHIYDLGFQSQNSEAAKPMVFTTTLLLILIVATLNMAAIMIRTRLRKKFITSAF